jgi:spermidine synthase
MSAPRVIDSTTTPDGAPVELSFEEGHYVIWVSDIRLMSSEMYGSEQAMAVFAQQELGEHPGPRVLVGGLGMGFTLRAALDAFGESAEITVAELLPALVDYNRGVLADLAGRPLEDPRVSVFEGDVRFLLRKRQWDVVLMDVDNGPNAFTTESNGSLYDDKGVARLARCLDPGGVLVVWSAFQSPDFEDRLAETGLSCRSEVIRGDWPRHKGPRHVLTIASRPK